MANLVPAPPTDPPNTRDGSSIWWIQRSIDSGFARFNTIITSLKALDEGFSSKNYVRKFLRALHPKWKAKVTTINESKDLSSLALDERISNLKVHEVLMEKDSKIYRGKKKRIKSIALKAKKESSDDETSTSESDDEEFAMALENFKKFFRRKGKFVRQPREETKSFQQRDEKKEKSGQKCFRYSDPNILIGDCLKPPRNKDQKAFIEGSWSDIAKMMPKTKLTMKLVSWLSRQMRKTPYEVFRGGKDSLKYFKVFGSKCFVLNTKDYLTKFDPKSYEDVFLGYSQNSKAYIVLNKHTMKVEESLNVTFDETSPPTKLTQLVDDDVGKEEAIIKNTKVVNNNNEKDESIEVDEIVNIKEFKNHPLDQVIRNLNERTLSQNLCDDFVKIMHDEFEMSMMGELYFFFGLHIKPMEDEIFFNQSEYIKEMLKKFRLEDSKPTKKPMSTKIKLTKDDEADSVYSSKYRECPKPPRSKNQMAFVGRAWSDSGEDEEGNSKDENCLVAQASNEICLGINLEPDEWIKDS
nr:zf-CCHC domain-containing protein/UBN2 domain-containing protein [Tanacetum cinerariifolium]